MRLHLVREGTSWPSATNIGIRESTGDVIVMDDDIVLQPGTFEFIDRNYDEADIFGFKLWFPDGRIQHAGGAWVNGAMGHFGWGEEDKGQWDGLGYRPHVTTSLAYIKRRVIENVGLFEEGWPGFQFEDVDFMFRALKKCYRILYTPGTGIPYGVGIEEKSA
jgi:GT2 family glycosyltransferase